MSQHTQGEWYQEAESDGNIWIGAQDNPELIANVCCYQTDYSDKYKATEEQLANAKLIAAAPESHEANLFSLALLSDIEMRIQNEEDPITPEIIGKISEGITKNVEAIKKATK